MELDIQELSSLESQSQRENVKKLLSSEINKLNQKKNNLIKKQENTGKDDVRPTQLITITNYAWDQTDEFVKVYIEFDKNCHVNQETTKLNFTNNKSFAIVFDKYKFAIGNLHSEVEPDKSYYKVTKSNRLIIYLKKMSKKQWININQVVDRLKTAIEDDKGELSTDQDGDPSASLMKMMKKMYDEGDDEMKRSIAKSWYESRQKNMTDTMDLP